MHRFNHVGTDVEGKIYLDIDAGDEQKMGTNMSWIMNGERTPQVVDLFINTMATTRDIAIVSQTFAKRGGAGGGVTHPRELERDREIDTEAPNHTSALIVTALAAPVRTTEVDCGKIGVNLVTR